MVPQSIGRKIELGEEDSKFVVALLTDQSDKLYQRQGAKFVRVPKGHEIEPKSEA